MGERSKEAMEIREGKKQRIVMGGGGGVAVWGGVAVAIATVVVASISAFNKSRKSTTRVIAEDDEDFEQGHPRCNGASTKGGTEPLEIIGKMSEDKIDKNEEFNDEEEKNDKKATYDVTQRDHRLAQDQVNPQEIEVGKGIGEITEALKARDLKAECDNKIRTEQECKLEENLVEKEEELAEEIEVDTQMILGDENEEDSDRNSTAEDKEILAGNYEKTTDIGEKEEEIWDCDEYVERGIHVSEIADHEVNDFVTKGGLVVMEVEGEEKAADEKESSSKEEVPRYGHGVNMVELEEESSETTEEDEEEQSSEGTEIGDSTSMGSNEDKIWPAEAMKDMSHELKQIKINNKISEEQTDDYGIIEMEEKTFKNISYCASDLVENKDFGESVFISRKRCLKQLMLDPANRRIWIWSILVLILALGAPFVLLPGDILKLSIIIFFVVTISRVFKTII